jgi:hypothetical protein
MIASTTKYTLKGIPFFIMFAIMSLKSIYQANNSRGLIAIKIRLRDFRTLTVWETAEDMKAFRNSGMHLRSMMESDKLGFNQSHSWQTDGIPTWSEAIVQLNKAMA